MTVATELERYMLDLVNAERRAQGLVELKLEKKLNTAAEAHSEWMLEADVFSHTGEGGSSPTERIRAAGFDLDGSWRTAENLAIQSERGAAGWRDDVEDLHEALMDSPGHRANILQPELRYVGIGIEGGRYRYDNGHTLDSVVVTQNFGTTDGTVWLDSGPGQTAAQTPPARQPAPVAEEPGTLRGTMEADRLGGGRGADRIEGLDGNDVLRGEAGDDRLDGGRGADLLHGGQGSDVHVVDDSGDRVIESGKWQGYDTVLSSIDFRLGRAHVEELQLTGEARIGIGNGLVNVIRGNAGDNLLDGGRNNDTLIGGAGNDTYHIRAPRDRAVETANGGIDTVKAFGSHALGAHVENLFLKGVRDDRGEGIDGINGVGNGLDNVIVGNPFDNKLIGRDGNDVLRGHHGADDFVFDRAPEPGNVDRIVDFNTNTRNEGDRLVMKAELFGDVGRGGLDEAELALGTAAGDARDRFVYDRDGGRLWFDADGDGAGAQQLVALFDRNADIEAGDFLFV